MHWCGIGSKLTPPTRGSTWPIQHIQHDLVDFIRIQHVSLRFLVPELRRKTFFGLTKISSDPWWFWKEIIDTVAENQVPKQGPGWERLHGFDPFRSCEVLMLRQIRMVHPKFVTTFHGWGIEISGGFGQSSPHRFPWKNPMPSNGAAQVSIIQGSTGSGKTTQVPQYILDSQAMGWLQWPQATWMVKISWNIWFFNGWLGVISHWGPQESALFLYMF